MSFNFMAVVTAVIFEPKGKEPKYFEEKQILSLGQELNKLILVYLIVTESKEILFKKSHIVSSDIKLAPLLHEAWGGIENLSL